MRFYLETKIDPKGQYDRLDRPIEEVAENELITNANAYLQKKGQKEAIENNNWHASKFCILPDPLRTDFKDVLVGFRNNCGDLIKDVDNIRFEIDHRTYTFDELEYGNLDVFIRSIVKVFPNAPKNKIEEDGLIKFSASATYLSPGVLNGFKEKLVSLKDLKTSDTIKFDNYLAEMIENISVHDPDC